MNNTLKYFAYISLLIHFSIISYEILRLFFINIPKYLSMYDLSSNRTGYLVFLIKCLVKIAIHICIVKVVDIKYKEEEEVKLEQVFNNELQEKEEIIKTELYEFNKQVDSSATTRWNYIRKVLYPYKAHITVYLYIIANNLSHPNLVLFILAPYIMYKVLYRLYSKHKYYKIFIWPLFAGLASVLYSFLQLKKSNIKVIDYNNIPLDILEYFIKRNYEVVICKVEADFYNVGVIGFMNSVAIFIFGDIWKLLSKNEFRSVLYHEIGHIVNKSILYRVIISKAISISMYVIEFIMIACSKKLIKPLQNNEDVERSNRDYVNNLIMLFILISVTIIPYLEMINNIYSNIDETEADRYSVSKHDRKHLINALIKLTVENNAYIDSSQLFNYMYFDHPSLKRRIEIINDM